MPTSSNRTSGVATSPIVMSLYASLTNLAGGMDAKGERAQLNYLAKRIASSFRTRIENHRIWLHDDRARIPRRRNQDGSRRVPRQEGRTSCNAEPVFRMVRSLLQPAAPRKRHNTVRSR